ncbi:3D domain-containing protein [Lactiplantibacillus dongliensis]|uniref:3D domain-containing protein n=1 Tax=Lactiplantibacillus dongliensis TaxID=2559919 RepID=A0ABW1R6K1_9LACO|nr:3D domain-containing protein [Lactiplantibacillus dongliensis]
MKSLVKIFVIAFFATVGCITVQNFSNQLTPSVAAASRLKKGKTYHVKATGYDAVRLGGRTASGYFVNSKKKKVIAVDPRVIKLGSKVKVKGYGTAIAADTGGLIKGRRIDLNMSTTKAIRFGYRTVKVTVIK